MLRRLCDLGRSFGSFSSRQSLLSTESQIPRVLRRKISSSAPTPKHDVVASSTSIPASTDTITPVKSVTGRIRVGKGNAAEDLNVKFWITAAMLDQFIRAEQKASFVDSEHIQAICAAQMAANDPLEDRYAVVREPGSDRIILMVADGHSGQFCAQELVDKLPDLVLKKWRERSKQFSSSSSSSQSLSLTEMEQMLQEAFQQFDDSLMHRLLDPAATLQSKRAALSGSCALMACIDGPDIYLANTGDCRAVLLTTNDQTSANNSTLRAVDLTQDQTLHNPSERARLIAEHPRDDPTTLTARNRILGGLEPTRAFGDAKYKASVEMHKQVVSRLLGPKSMRAGYQSPPYVTAKPVVTHHRIDSRSVRPSASSITSTADVSTPTRGVSGVSGDCALVLATDGLWGKLRSDQVASLMDMHVRQFPPAETDFEDDDRQSVDGGVDAGWALVDANPATHLLRNALGGASHTALIKQVGTVPPHTRKIRDDITCLVVYFSQPGQSKP